MTASKRAAFRTAWAVGAVILGSSVMLWSRAAIADTPLNRAVVQSLRNRVQLILNQRSPRPAKVQDAMKPGDALSTAQRSLAELRFNDGSLARVGEQSMFRFLPNTRTFRLSNGTLLLLIPPGQGQTRVRTPNAATGIRGSALFVRYTPESDTTLVGALTTSGIEVANRNNTQQYLLKGGQLAVIVNDHITEIRSFDLRQFYETSNLTSGLSLTQADAAAGDSAIAAVREETMAALATQQATPETINSVNGTVGMNLPVSPVANQLTPQIAETLSLTRYSPSLLPTAVVRAETTSFSSSQLLGLANGLAVIPDGSTPTGLVTDSLVLPTPTTDLIPAIPALGATIVQPALPVVGEVVNGVVPALNKVSPGALAPGLTGTAPGLAGTTPGQGGLLPPGQGGTPPGKTLINPGAILGQ